jgi:hypothetical protein
MSVIHRAGINVYRDRRQPRERLRLPRSPVVSRLDKRRRNSRSRDSTALEKWTVAFAKRGCDQISDFVVRLRPGPVAEGEIFDRLPGKSRMELACSPHQPMSSTTARNVPALRCGSRALGQLETAIRDLEDRFW